MTCADIFLPQVYSHELSVIKPLYNCNWTSRFTLMSSWLVYLFPSWVWRCPAVTIGGATCHQVVAYPVCRPCHLERDFDCFRDGSCQLGRTSRSPSVCVLPLFPRYQQMLIYRQNRTWKRFIHLPSPPHIMSLAGNCNSCADLYVTYPHMTSCRWRGTAFCMQVLSLIYISFSAQRRSPDPRRRTRNWGPLLVNSHDSTSTGTPSLALPFLSYAKAVEGKAAVSLLSGGKFSHSVFIISIMIT